MKVALWLDFVFEGAQPRSLFWCVLYRSQIRLKRLGQSPCSAYICVALLIKDYESLGSGIIKGNHKIQWFLCVCEAMLYAPLWHLQMGEGVSTLSVWFANMQNECNLWLVGAVETSVIKALLGWSVGVIWCGDLHWDPDHCWNTNYYFYKE